MAGVELHQHVYVAPVAKIVAQDRTEEKSNPGVSTRFRGLSEGSHVTSSYFGATPCPYGVRTLC